MRPENWPPSEDQGDSCLGWIALLGIIWLEWVLGRMGGECFGAKMGA